MFLNATRRWARVTGLCALATATLVGGAVRAEPATDGHSLSKLLPGTYIDVRAARAAIAAGGHIGIHRSMTPAKAHGATSRVSSSAASSGATLPLWQYNFQSARDGLHHQGVMVGTDPFTAPGTARVPTHIIPVVFVLHSIAQSFDPNTGIITTAPGRATTDPARADNNCLSSPNNVPARLLLQSPIFTPASFTFGSTYLGVTQYHDAFMRANFYGPVGGQLRDYHTLFAPVDSLSPLVLDVPASEGVAITNGDFFGSPGFCAPLAIVDINWLDNLINDQILPAYAQAGVNPTNLPVFLTYNTVLAAPANNLASCCVLGYHSFSGFPTPTQAYSVADFDTTGAFGPGVANTSIISHELGEFLNDPFGSNLVPPWGDTGQVSGCQGNLEVGDPLTGTNMPAVTMPNGFTYSLQELAFFSWFFGGPSIAANGWYSANGTFATDAGTPCLLM